MQVAAAYAFLLASFPGIGPGSFPPHGFPRFLGFDSKTVQADAASELLLASFPGVGPGSFLHMVFLVFGIRFQNGAKVCIV